MTTLQTLFSWILTTTWQASVLALLILAVQTALGRRLNPRWRHALWLLVLLRLLLPDLPQSTLSLFQFAPPPPAPLVTTVTQPWQPLYTGKPYPAPTDPEPTVKPNYPFSWYTLLALLWLTGATGLLLLTLLVNYRFARHVARSPEITDPALREILARAQADLRLRRPIRLIESPHLTSPAIMGLLTPTLLLPVGAREKFTPRELRYIFLHELAHLKRGDIAIQALIALLQILHWFNPVLWYAFRRMRLDREPATDALVLSRTGEADKEPYGLLLLKLLDHFNQRHSLPTLVGILEDKDHFKRRFTLIARFTRGAYGWSLLGVVLIAVLAIVCLTKAKAAPPASQPTNPNAQLITAVQKGDAATLQKLIDQGADPNKVEDQGQPLIFDATSPEVAEILLQHGADANARNAQKDAVINSDCRGGGKQTAALIRVLLAHGADPNTRAGELGETPLMDARDAATIDLLVAHGADVNAKLTDGIPGYIMYCDKPLECLQALLRHGLHFDLKTDGPTLLSQAAWVSNLPVMTYLLDRGVDPNAKGVWAMSDNGKPDLATPLENAVIDGQLDAVKLLIKYGAKSDGKTLIALQDGYPKTVKFLWDAGVREISPLCYAVSQGASAAELQKLLDQGSPADPPLDKVITPLGVAAMLGKLDIVKLLLAHHADPNAGGNLSPQAPKYWRRSPLILASAEGQDEVVTYLLQHGATPDPAALYQAGFNSTPYTEQRSKEHFEKTARILIDAGALKNITPDTAGLVLAGPIGTRQGPPNPTVVKMLLDAGLSPELPMPYLAENGEKPNTIIGYYRDYYQKRKDDPNYATSVATIKPILALLEAADKAAPASSSSNSTTVISGTRASILTAPTPPSAAQLAQMNAEEASKTPLMQALEQRNFAKAKELIDQGADVTATDKLGNTPLVYLVNFAGMQEPFPLDLLSTLLKTQQNPNPPDYSPSTPPQPPDATLEVLFMGAAQCPEANLPSTRQAVTMLLNHGAVFDQANGDAQRVLRAAAQGDLATLQKLAASGISLNTTDRAGWSALLITTALGYTEATNWLLDHGANVNAPSRRGAEDPLTFAADHGDDALVEKMIALGAKPDLAWRGLEHAINRNDQRLFDDLIKAGVTMKDAGGITGSAGGKAWRQIISEPLFTCIKYGQTAMAVTLLDKGVEAEPAGVDNNQNYAYWAVTYDRPEILRALLQHGANPQLKDRFGETPLTLAQKKHPDLLPIFAATAKADPAPATPSASPPAADERTVSNFKITDLPLPDVAAKITSMTADAEHPGVPIEAQIPPGEAPLTMTYGYPPYTGDLGNLLYHLSLLYPIRYEFRDAADRAHWASTAPVVITQLSAPEIQLNKKAAQTRVSLDFHNTDIVSALKSIQAQAAAKGFAFNLDLEALKNAPLPVVSAEAQDWTVPHALSSLCYLSGLVPTQLEKFTGYRVAPGTPAQLHDRVSIRFGIATALSKTDDATADTRIEASLSPRKDIAKRTWGPAITSPAYAWTYRGQQMSPQPGDIGDSFLYQPAPGAKMLEAVPGAAFVDVHFLNTPLDSTRIKSDLTLLIKKPDGTILRTLHGQFVAESGTVIRLVPQGAPLLFDTPGDPKTKSILTVLVQANYVDNSPWENDLQPDDLDLVPPANTLQGVQVADAPPPGTSTAPATTNVNPASTHSDQTVYLQVKALEISDEDYQSHRDAVDAAVQKGDSGSLSTLGIVQVLGQPGCYVTFGHLAALGLNVGPSPTTGEAPAREIETELTPTLDDHGAIKIAGKIVASSIHGSGPLIGNEARPNIIDHRVVFTLPLASNHTAGIEMPGTQDDFSPAHAYDHDVSSSEKPQRLLFFITASTTPPNPAPAADAAPDPAVMLTTIRLDLPAFSGASLDNVIAQLSQATVRNDPAHQGISFVVPQTDAARALRLDLPALKNVPVADAVNAIAREAKLTYTVNNGAVYLRLLSDSVGALTVRTFMVPAGFFAPASANETDVKAQLLARGISFTGDSTATYLREQDKVVVRGTPDALDALQTILEAAAKPAPPSSTSAQPDPAPAPAAAKSDLLEAREAADARQALVGKLKIMPDDLFVATMEGLGRADPEITALHTKIADENADITNLLYDGFASTHPRIVSLRAEVNSREEELKHLVEGQRRALDIDLQMADARVAVLQQSAGSAAAPDPATLQQQLAAAQQDLAARRAMDDKLRPLPDDQFLTTIQGLGRRTPELDALDQKLAGENADITNLLNDGFASTHPRIVSLRAEVQAREADRRRLIDGLRSSLDIDLKMAESRVDLLKKQLDPSSNNTPSAPTPQPAPPPASPSPSTQQPTPVLTPADYNPANSPPARFQDVTVSGRLKLVSPDPIDWTKSIGCLLGVDGGYLEFRFQPDGSFTIPHLKPGVYNWRVHAVSADPQADIAKDVMVDSSPLTVDGTAAKMTANSTIDARIERPPKGSIEIGMKLVEVDDAQYQADKARMDAAVARGDSAFFNNLEHVSMLSTPNVTTTPGLKANIDIVREFPYPTSFETPRQTAGPANTALVIPPTPREFTTKDVGVSAEITPTINPADSPDPGKIVLLGTVSVIDFEGFIQSNVSGVVNMPSFTTSESHFLEQVGDHQQKGVWIPGLHVSEPPAAGKNAPPYASAKPGAAVNRLLLFVTASRAP